MATETTDNATTTCPACGHENLPHAKFCAKCGQALDDRATPPDESQATSAFEPVTATDPETTWSESEAERTTALPVQDAVWAPSRPASDDYHLDRNVPRHRESPRGFFLGAFATLLILAVLAYYIYAAWFSESLQSDIAGWMPW